jgi:hypothetical protein
MDEFLIYISEVGFSKHNQAEKFGISSIFNNFAWIYMTRPIMLEIFAVI